MNEYAAPVAYIRRSVARTGDPGDVSREFQTEKVRSLANGDGPTLRIIDGDWGVSAGRKHAHRREAFMGMLSAIEAGQVSAVYAYSTDRLARDVEAAARLLNACERAGVVIVTGEGRFAPGDRMARQLFHFSAMQNEAALENMTEKASSVYTKRRERGDHVGRAPYGYRHAMIDGRSQLVPRDDEDPARVVDAFIREGSYLGASKALNEEGFPTRFGRSWGPTAVRHVVLRERPELAPVRTRRGAVTRPKRLFARLLRCPHADEHPATPMLTSMPRATGAVYYCLTAHQDPTHPRPYMVREAVILEWAKAEVARLGKVITAQVEREVRKTTKATAESLDERRDRVLQMFEDGDIDRDEKTRRLAKIDAERDALEPTLRWVGQGMRITGKVEWDADPATVNERLRNLWQYVELDADMRPVRAVYWPGMEPKS